MSLSTWCDVRSLAFERRPGLRAANDPGVRRAILALSRNYNANDLKGSGLRPGLAAIRCPTLIVWGSEDCMFPLRYAREAETAIPGAQLVVIPRCPLSP